MCAWCQTTEITGAAASPGCHKPQDPVGPRTMTTSTRQSVPRNAPVGATTKYFADRAPWRRWLRHNCKTATEVWLIYFRKSSGKPRIAQYDAVEEALCFGWVDSNVKSLDCDRFAQPFTPGKHGSSY